MAAVRLGGGDYTFEVNESWAKIPDDIVLGDCAAVGVDSKDNVYAFNRGEHPVVRLFELRVPQEDDVRVLLRQRRRLAAQGQPNFLGPVVCLAPVALPAGDHHVLPAIRCAAPRHRDHMVDGELGGGAEAPAVLARVIVTKEQVAAVGTEQAARHVDGAQQADDDDTLGQSPPRECFCRGSFGRLVNERHPLLGQEYHQPPVTDHVERLQRGVEQQHCHCPNSSWEPQIPG